MNKTTMKVDRDVLLDLRALATTENRTPQQHLRFLVDREKAKLLVFSGKKTVTKEQKERADIVARVEASEALEGYAPLSADSGVAYQLEQRWIQGEITLEQKGALLAEYYGFDYLE